VFIRILKDAKFTTKEHLLFARIPQRDYYEREPVLVSSLVFALCKTKTAANEFIPTLCSTDS